jgi:hypothetical protein
MDQKTNQPDYQELKKAVIEIVQETPNDSLLGNKMRVFTQSLSEDIILENKDIQSKDHI